MLWLSRLVKGKSAISCFFSMSSSSEISFNISATVSCSNSFEITHKFAFCTKMTSSTTLRLSLIEENLKSFPRLRPNRKPYRGEFSPEAVFLTISNPVPNPATVPKNRSNLFDTFTDKDALLNLGQRTVASVS